MPLNIHACESWRESVGDLERVLNRLLGRDRYFIHSFHIKLVGMLDDSLIRNPHIFAQRLKALLLIPQYSGDPSHVGPKNALDNLRILLGILSCRPKSIYDERNRLYLHHP